MIMNIVDKLVYELYYAPYYVPVYTLTIIAFWYVVFLALFDIMQLLSELFETYVQPVLKKFVRKIILCVYLRYLDLSDRVRFYQDKKEIKGGSIKEIKGLEDKTDNDIIE